MISERNCRCSSARRGSDAVSNSIEQAGSVLGVQGDDAVGGELPCRRRTDADHLTGMKTAEVRQGVPAGDAGNAGNQQGKTRGQVGM